MKKFILFLIVILGLGGLGYYFLSPNSLRDDQIQRLSSEDTLSGHYESSYSGFSIDLVIENASTATLSVGASIASVSLSGTLDTTNQSMEVVVDNSLIASAFGVEEGTVVTAYYDQIDENQLNFTLGNVTLNFIKS